MNLLIWIIVVILSGAGLKAQTCTPEILATYPGKWKQGMQGSINGVSATSLVKQKEIVAAFVKRLQQNINPKGFNIYYSGVYGYVNPDLVKNRKTDTYELSISQHQFFCENSQVKEYPETPYWVHIQINKIPYSGSQSFFVQKTKYEEDPHTDELFMLDASPVKEKSAWLLKEDYSSIKGFKSYKWIIPYNDELPCRYLTEKEFCTKLIAYFQKRAKYATIENDIDYNKKLIACAEDYLRKTSEQDLKRPAQVWGGMTSIFYQYWDNVPPFRPDGSYVTDISPDYFKASLPMHTPQIITLEFIVDEKDELIMNLMYKMIEALDIGNMKTMLGNPNPFGKTSLSGKDTNQVIQTKLTTTKNSIDKQPASSVKQENKLPASATISNPVSNIQKTDKREFDPSKPVYDLDSNKYTVIKIGKQYWFKENLRTTQYNDTTLIAAELSDNEWKQTNKGAFSVYQNNSVYETIYGKLYNGYAVRTGKLCPKGWRVATDKDWKELELFLGLPASELERTGERGNIADKLKAAGNWK